MTSNEHFEQKSGRLASPSPTVDKKSCAPCLDFPSRVHIFYIKKSSGKAGRRRGKKMNPAEKNEHPNAIARALPRGGPLFESQYERTPRRTAETFCKINLPCCKKWRTKILNFNSATQLLHQPWPHPGKNVTKVEKDHKILLSALNMERTKSRKSRRKIFCDCR